VAQPTSSTQQLSSKPRERSDSNQIVVPFRDIDQIISKLQGQAKVDFEKSLIYTDINNAKGLVQTTDTAFNKAQEAINQKNTAPAAQPPANQKTEFENFIQQNKNRTINFIYEQMKEQKGRKMANDLIRYFIQTRGKYDNPTDLVGKY
jgi:chromosomal replication initiation ATPase DnaA